MSSIRDTVREALRTSGLQGYERQAGPVITALEQREQEIADAVRRVAQDKGLRSHEIDGVMRQVGLADSSTSTSTSASGGSADLASLQRQVDSLTAFARQNGYRG
jgi:hypothetical protein